jgi:GxxExxY protein
MWADPWTGPVIGAAIEVHRAVGPGLLASVYELLLAEELLARGIAFERQKPVPIRYRGLVLEGGLRLDFVVENKLVLELTSVDRMHELHEARLLTYLRLGGYPVGLLINFNVRSLRQGIRRFVHKAPE